jgi:hypothetical protein
MSHYTVQYIRSPAKIGMPGSAGMLSTARTPTKAGPPATASLKGKAEMLATPGTPAIAGRPATVTQQELKGRQQQQE